MENKNSLEWFMVRAFESMQKIEATFEYDDQKQNIIKQTIDFGVVGI